MEAADLIRLANERMTITRAFELVGLEVGYGSSKNYCPFGDIYHFDGGTSKALRIYPETNSAWCFAGCGYFNPVKLLALHEDIPEVVAAERILDLTGYVPDNYEARLESLLNEQPRVDTDALAEALKLACSRMSKDWEELQFDPHVSAKLTQCLELLPRVRSAEDAGKWMAVTRAVMHQAIGGV